MHFKKHIDCNYHPEMFIIYQYVYVKGVCISAIIYSNEIYNSSLQLCLGCIIHLDYYLPNRRALVSWAVDLISTIDC
jgi:hypothetical protein